MSNKIVDYINKNWDLCIKNNVDDDGTLIGLPYPYIVPAVGHFDEMYYWDTFFTNKGLMLSGRHLQVKYNTDDMLYLVNRYGFMPNGNRTYYLRQSQPPFLSEMVRDVYDYYHDKDWLREAYKTLVIEYNFWMNKRLNKIGLNSYDGVMTDSDSMEMARDFERRTGYMPKVDLIGLGRHCLLSCESGWDINPRWEFDGYNYAHVDLNSLMYMFEKNMQFFSSELNENERLWEEKANERKSKMEKYMLDENQLFLDYNFEMNKKSDVFSAASFYPLFVKMANNKQAEALLNNLDKLEEKYGIATCEKNNLSGTYQWDYPNGWACLQYIVIKALDNYGYIDSAKRIAQKYTLLVEKEFEQSGTLWEKYNVVEGNINVKNEYKMPKMMGWSAGVYLWTLNYLGKL